MEDKDSKDNLIKIESIMREIRTLHDGIKEHPYWRVFDHAMFRNEVSGMFRGLMGLIGDLTYMKGYDSDSPFFAVHRMLYHDFSAMIRIIYGVSKCEETDEFKSFYLPVLQNYVQLVHCFIEEIEDDIAFVMFMPDNAYHPKKLEKHVPYFHEKWVTKDGYSFYLDDRKWHTLKEVRRNDVDEIVSELRKKSDKTSIDGLKEFYKQAIKDISDNTRFWYIIK